MFSALWIRACCRRQWSHYERMSHCSRNILPHPPFLSSVLFLDTFKDLDPQIWAIFSSKSASLKIDSWSQFEAQKHPFTFRLCLVFGYISAIFGSFLMYFFALLRPWMQACTLSNLYSITPQVCEQSYLQSKFLIRTQLVLICCQSQQHDNVTCLYHYLALNSSTS